MATLEDIPIELLFQMMLRNPEIISPLTKVSRNAYDMVYGSKNEGEDYSSYFQVIMDKTRQHTDDGDYIFNGLKHGLWRELNPLTGLVDTRNYQFGKLEGESIIYNNINVDTPFGIVRYKFSYKNGKLDGEAVIHHSNRTTSTLTYNDGFLDGKISFNTDNFKYHGQFKNGVPDGKWTITTREGTAIVEFKNNITYILNPSKIYDRIEILHEPFLDSYNLPPRDVLALIDNFNILSKPITIKLFKDDRLDRTYVYVNETLVYIGQDSFVPTIGRLGNYHEKRNPSIGYKSPIFYNKGQTIRELFGVTFLDFNFLKSKLSSININRGGEFATAEFNNLFLTSNNIKNLFTEGQVEGASVIGYAYDLYANNRLSFVTSKRQGRLLDLKVPGITFDTFETTTGVIESDFHNINYGITQTETYFDYISKVDNKLEAEVIINHETGEQKYKVYSNGVTTIFGSNFG